MTGWDIAEMIVEFGINLTLFIAVVWVAILIIKEIHK